TIATLYVTKQSLLPTGVQTFDQYQEVSLPFNADLCLNDTIGPHDIRNRAVDNCRLNLRVTWIGNEDVAIRSIAIRDTIGAMMLGTSLRTHQDSMLHRGGDSLRAVAVQFVRQSPTIASPTRWPIIAM